MEESNINNLIALSVPYRNRLRKINRIGINNKKFIPDSFDFTRVFTTYQKDNQVNSDKPEGFLRLFIDEKYVAKQIKDLKIELQNFKGHLRYLIRLPDNFLECDKLRAVFNLIQEEARIKTVFIQTSKTETFEAVDNYLDTLDRDFILVLDMAMKRRDLSRLIEKYIDKCEEIVLLYRKWDENPKNFHFVTRIAMMHKNKLHMAFVPIELNLLGIRNIYSTALICSDFKSVSLIDTEIPRYLLKHIRNRSSIRTHKEKINNSLWINAELNSYENKHPRKCNCLGDNIFIKEVMIKCGIKDTITFHNLEDLSMIYREIKSNENTKKKFLELESVQSLLNLS